MLIIRRIDWKVVRNRECVVLGALGFSYRLINSRTGLTKHQIGYRLRKAGIRLRDYREGQSEFSRYVLRRTSKSVRASIDKKLLTQ